MSDLHFAYSERDQRTFEEGRRVLGEMARALNVFKMRGSWHDKGIREFIITSNGPEIKDSFTNFERIISGVPHRISIDERSELARIVRGVEAD